MSKRERENVIHSQEKTAQRKEPRNPEITQTLELAASPLTYCFIISSRVRIDEWMNRWGITAEKKNDTLRL